MRRIATLSLIGVFIVLVMSSVGVVQYPALAWLRAFAEAATVGAVADWFAVVALFRHPLGLPIPLQPAGSKPPALLIRKLGTATLSLLRAASL